MELYKEHEIDDIRFYKIPKTLIKDERFKGKLNSDARLVYALLLDRMELSRKNKWINERGEIYLIYTREEIAKDLDISKPTSIKAIKMLLRCGLIREEKQGLKKPNLIYVAKLH